MFRLNIEFKERYGQNGKKYRIPYCYDFGYALTVSLNGNMQVQQDRNGYFIVYDPHNAEIKINKDGYLVFHVTDQNYNNTF